MEAGETPFRVLLGAVLPCGCVHKHGETCSFLPPPQLAGLQWGREIPPGSVSLSTEPLVLPAAKASLNSQAAKLASSKTFLFSPSMSSSVCNVREDSEQAGEDVPGTLPSLSLSVSIILGHGGCKAPPSPLHFQPSWLSWKAAVSAHGAGCLCHQDSLPTRSKVQLFTTPWKGQASDRQIQFLEPRLHQGKARP